MSKQRINLLFVLHWKVMLAATTIVCTVRGSPTVDKVALVTDREYKESLLQDVSNDGRHLLFSRHTQHMQYFTIYPDGRTRVHRPEKELASHLVVVERESGRQLAEMAAEFVPTEEQFVPNSSKVFYKEKVGQGYQFTLWDFVTGEKRKVASDDELAFSHVRLLDSHRAVGNTRVRGDAWGKLGLLDLETGIRKAIDVFDPLNPQESGMRGNISFSPDGAYFAYRCNPNPAIVIRRTNTLQVQKRVDLSSLDERILAESKQAVGDKAMFTTDGEFLVLTSSDLGSSDTNRRYKIFLFDTSTYELKHEVCLDLIGKSASAAKRSRLSFQFSSIAISPDSRNIAVAFTEDDRRAVIVIFELVTGKEITRAAYPPVKPKRSDPFLATVSYLAYTPDGEFLLSSTYDTRVWRVEARPDGS